MANKATIDKYETKATVDEYKTKAVIAPYSTKVTNIQNVAKEIALIFEWEARLETGYLNNDPLNPVTNFDNNVKPDASQSDPDGRAIYLTDQINGHPAIQFDAVDDFYNHDDNYKALFQSTKFGFVLVTKVLDGQPASGQVFYGTRNYDSSGKIILDEISIILQSDGNVRVDYKADEQAMRYTTDSPMFVDGENPWHTLLFHLDFDNNIVTFRKDKQDLAVSNTAFSSISDIDPSKYGNSVDPDNPGLGALEDLGSFRLFINAKYTAFYKNAVNLADLKVKEDEYFTRYDDTGEQPISSIKTTAEFYNEIRLETGYTDTQNVNPLTNFADSAKPNATQATPSKQGQYVANDINGYPSILVDGVDDFYDLGDSYESFFQQNWGFVTVLKHLDGQGGTQFLLSKRPEGGGDRYSGQILTLSDGKLRSRYDTDDASGNQITAIYTSNNAVFTAGENPYKIITVFWDFDNDNFIMRINGSGVTSALTGGNDISQINPANFVESGLNFRYFARDDGFYMNCRSAAPPIAFNSLIDAQNAETKLNEKYAIY